MCIPEAAAAADCETEIWLQGVADSSTDGDGCDLKPHFHSSLSTEADNPLKVSALKPLF